MDNFVVNQTVFDRKRTPIGHEIIFSESNSYAEEFMRTMKRPLYFENKPAFITLNKRMLEKNLPSLFPPNDTVIQLDRSSVSDRQVHSLVSKFRQKGYKTAAVDFKFTPDYFSVLDQVDYIKVSFKSYASPATENIIRLGKSFGKGIMAYDIQCAEAYEKAKILNCMTFQGAYVAEKPMGHSQKSLADSDFAKLLAEINRPVPDVSKAEKIITDNSALTKGVLRLASSPYFALITPVETVGQAMTHMGIRQLRRLAYLLPFDPEDNYFPRELIKLSLLRAAFTAELHDFADDMTISRTDAYYMGMYSLLGRILHCPLVEALDILPMDSEIKDAILFRKGRSGQLLDLVKEYESAHRDKVITLADDLGIPTEVISEKYRECYEQVRIERFQ
ncbi:MAG: HDOD domain-containing protein [Oscillospiraceae bacterium]|nr:HDOD domain-containing protein [Oscillospiraceae bacterium]